MGVTVPRPNGASQECQKHPLTGGLGPVGSSSSLPPMPQTFSLHDWANPGEAGAVSGLLQTAGPGGCLELALETCAELARTACVVAWLRACSRAQVHLEERNWVTKTKT